MVRGDEIKLIERMSSARNEQLVRLEGMSAEIRFCHISDKMALTVVNL